MTQVFLGIKQAWRDFHLNQLKNNFVPRRGHLGEQSAEWTGQVCLRNGPIQFQPSHQRSHQDCPWLRGGMGLPVCLLLPVRSFECQTISSCSTQPHEASWMGQPSSTGKLELQGNDCSSIDLSSLWRDTDAHWRQNHSWNPAGLHAVDHNLWAQNFSQFSVYLTVHLFILYFISLSVRILWEALLNTLLKQK